MKKPISISNVCSVLFPCMYKYFKQGKKEEIEGIPDYLNLYEVIALKEWINLKLNQDDLDARLKENYFYRLGSDTIGISELRVNGFKMFSFICKDGKIIELWKKVAR